MSSKYPVKYLELFFVSTNFEMNILSTLTSQVFTGFFVAPQNSSFATFVLLNFNTIIPTKNFVAIIFYFN